MSRERIKLWDLPTRLFHWLLVLLIIAAFVTGKMGGNAMDWHGRIGILILGLITFRLVWGLIGSHHSLFASFWPTPTSVRAYLNGQWRGLGHNPLGAFSVLALLALTGLQVVTGLFGNDDIAFNGPLSALISKELSDKLSGIHKLSINVLIVLIVLHLGAIAFHAFIKKDNLIKPMLTGWKDVQLGDEGEKMPAKTWSRSAGAVIVGLLIALAAMYGGSGAWRAATQTPSASVATTSAG